MSADKEEVWRKLSEPWYVGKCKISLSADGTMLFKDIYGDGTEVDIYELSTPFQIDTATYKETEYCSAWGMVT